VGPQIITDMLHVVNRDVRQPGLTSQWFYGGALEATTSRCLRDDIAHKCGSSVSTEYVRKKLEGSAVGEGSLPEIVRVWLASINGKDIVYYSYNNLCLSREKASKFTCAFCARGTVVFSS
jgi:hypothetical protein